MEVTNRFYFIKNIGQLQSPCDYALIQADYQVHFYKKKIIFYLTKEELMADRIVMKLTDCPTVQLIAKNERIESNEMSYETLRYENVCDGVDLEYSVEAGQLVQKIQVSEGACIDQLHLQFEGQKEIILADEDTIRLEGAHESFELKCPSAAAVMINHKMK